MEKAWKDGETQTHKVVKVGNLKKRIYGAATLRYVPAEILRMLPSDTKPEERISVIS
jgi:hypothetical protein